MADDGVVSHDHGGTDAALNRAKLREIAGWAGELCAWAGVGVGATFVVLGAASIGLFLIPVVLSAAVLLLRRSGGRSAPAALVGVGFTLIAFSVGAEDYVACTGQSVTTFEGETTSCGGIDPAVVGPLGGLIAVVGIATTVIVRRRSGSADDLDARLPHSR
jgi:hypothetical protein